MKIDRVILSANNNPLYYHFWNPLSKVYFEKFNILPTLIWYGTPEEITQLGLSDAYGDIIICQPNTNYPLPFQTTWGLFYHTKLFPNDVCLTIGIDQVPLSGMFIKDMIAHLTDDNYVMLIADAYMPHHWTVEGSASPTAYHIGKGETFNKIYQFENNFADEIEKICTAGVKAFWEDTAGRWGMDETYSSKMLRAYRDANGKIVSMNNFGLLCERRIECERHKETPFDVEKLKQGFYSESHLCRPFTNHVDYITKMFEIISNYK